MALTQNSQKDSKTFVQQHAQKIVAVTIWAIFAGGVFFYMRSNGLSFGDLIRNLSDVLASPLGPVLYIALYILRPVLFFPASIITVAGGVIFGPIGVLWVVIGSNLSALLAYFIGRFLGDGLLDANESEGIVQRYAQRMRENSFETVLIMRFVYAPYDLVNYLSGILRIDWKPFLLATIIGCVPGTISFTLAGASLELEDVLNGELPSLDPKILAFSVLMFVVSMILSRYFKNRESA